MLNYGESAAPVADLMEARGQQGLERGGAVGIRPEAATEGRVREREAEVDAYSDVAWRTQPSRMFQKQT